MILASGEAGGTADSSQLPGRGVEPALGQHCRYASYNTTTSRPPKPLLCESVEPTGGVGRPTGGKLPGGKC